MLLVYRCSKVQEEEEEGERNLELLLLSRVFGVELDELWLIEEKGEGSSEVLREEALRLKDEIEVPGKEQQKILNRLRRLNFGDR